MRGYRVEYELVDGDNSKAYGAFYLSGDLPAGVQGTDLLGTGFKPEELGLTPLYGNLGMKNDGYIFHVIVDVQPASVFSYVLDAALFYATVRGLDGVAGDVDIHMMITSDTLRKIASAFEDTPYRPWVTIEGDMRVGNAEGASVHVMLSEYAEHLATSLDAMHAFVAFPTVLAVEVLQENKLTRGWNPVAIRQMRGGHDLVARRLAQASAVT